MKPRTFVRLTTFLVIAMALFGCAGELAFRDGKSLLAAGKHDEALAQFEQATKESPDNLEFRVAYRTARETTLNRLVTEAQREHDAGRLDAAEKLYRQAQRLDANNLRVTAGLAALDKSRRHAALLAEATSLLSKGDLEGADQRLARVLTESPQNTEARELKRQLEEKADRAQVLPPALRKTYRRTISLEFREASFKQVIESLSRHTGLNFILDKDVPPTLQTTVFLRQVSVEDALDVILTTHQLGSRVLNDTTLLIFPNTAAKQTEHQELVVKSFFLANANAKQVMEMLKSVLKAKNVYVDEKLNLLIMRDTPNAIRVAERLIALNDVPEPEVMLEVEVIEVQRTQLQQLGIQFPDQLTLTPLASNGTTVTLADLRNPPSSRIGATLSNAAINLHKDIGDTNILANPRIRTHNREKAEIKIGDRVPVITTTSTSTGFVAENVQYVDVGLKVNVEPVISPDNEILIRLSLEVSSVVKQVTSKAGTLAYQIGTRNATSVLRLKDGETQILGGLINDHDRTSANRVPGLGDLPILGRLFSSQTDDTQKTELLLSITPRIVRGIAPPPHVPTEFWSGTESNLRTKPLAISGTKTAAATQPTSPANASATGAIAVPAAAGAPSEAADSAVPVVSNDPAVKAPMLRWEGPTQVKPGETFALKLWVSSSSGISGFPIQIKYDPQMIEVVDALPGKYLAQNGAKVDFGKRVVTGSGMAFITQNRAEGEAKGDGDLLEVKLKALKAGPNTIVSVLPATAIAAGNRPLPQTGPTLTGIAVSP